MGKDDKLHEPQQPKSKKLKKENKVFQDAAHGTISLPGVCMVVVDTPEFQRLRGLRQLGMVHMVYPSATHTRFEHSLGVCILAGQLVRSLKEKQPELGIEEGDVLCVQLAGLCHDLGHGPLGHFWESFARNELQKETWSHEEMSVRMLDYLLKKNSLKDIVSADDLTFIKAMMHPAKGYKLPEKYQSKEFLLQVVSNKETGIDVDKWDYILRDSLHLGLKVTFDPKRFIEYSRVIEKDGVKLICFRDKMYKEVLEMFQTRYELHYKAYKHKVVQCIDLMIADALRAEMMDNEEFKKMLDKFDDPDIFTKLTDEVVQKLRNSKNEDVKRIFHRIDTRQLYKCIDENKDKKNHPHSNAENDPKVTQMKVKLNYGNKGKNPVERVYFYPKDNPNTARHLPPGTSIFLPDRFQVKFRRVIHKDPIEAMQE